MFNESVFKRCILIFFGVSFETQVCHLCLREIELSIPFVFNRCYPCCKRFDFLQTVSDSLKKGEGHVFFSPYNFDFLLELESRHGDSMSGIMFVCAASELTRAGWNLNTSGKNKQICPAFLLIVWFLWYEMHFCPFSVSFAPPCSSKQKYIVAITNNSCLLSWLASIHLKYNLLNLSTFSVLHWF